MVAFIIIRSIWISDLKRAGLKDWLEGLVLSHASVQLLESDLI